MYNWNVHAEGKPEVPPIHTELLIKRMQISHDTQEHI